MLPGTDLLGAGYEPAGSECEFDACRTRQIFEWTFVKQRAAFTPGGTFRVPDQIRVLNVYRTKATTNVYMSEKQKEEKMAVAAAVSFSGYSVKAKASASYGKSGTESKQESIAERAIGVDLYTMRSEPTEDPTTAYNPLFMTELSSLPLTFARGPHSYLKFIRTWGRYVVVGGTFGGTLTLDMRYESSATASASDLAVGVEAAYDGVVSAGGSVSLDMSSKAKSLMANSKISIYTSGGDPSVAATITDLVPGTDKSATFRGDLLAWLRSIPQFPRLSKVTVETLLL